MNISRWLFQLPNDMERSSKDGTRNGIIYHHKTFGCLISVKNFYHHIYLKRRPSLWCVYVRVLYTQEKDIWIGKSGIPFSGLYFYYFVCINIVVSSKYVSKLKKKHQQAMRKCSGQQQKQSKEMSHQPNPTTKRNQKKKRSFSLSFFFSLCDVQ